MIFLINKNLGQPLVPALPDGRRRHRALQPQLRAARGRRLRRSRHRLPGRHLRAAVPAPRRPVDGTNFALKICRKPHKNLKKIKKFEKLYLIINKKI